MKVIIWADEPNNGLPVRDDLRAKGHTAMIRDARAFAGFADVERCDALAFVDASKRAFIIAEYRTPAAQDRYGQVLVFDVDTGDFGEPIAPLDIPHAPQEPVEPTEDDLLASRTDRLSDDDLRTFVKVKTGVSPPEDASREDLEAALRKVDPGAPQVPPAPPAPAEGATQADEAPQPPPTEDTPPPPPAAPETPGRGRGRGKPPAVDKAD